MRCLALALALCSCAPSEPPSSALDALACDPDGYSVLVVRMAIELSVACKPLTVEKCGVVADDIIARYEPLFDAWEKECEQ